MKAFLASMVLAMMFSVGSVYASSGTSQGGDAEGGCHHNKSNWDT